MAKGLRAKCKRRYRAVRRQHVLQTVEKFRLQEIHSKLELLQQGEDLTHLDLRPPNAFLHPDAPGAVFPQKLPGPPPLDFRCSKLGFLAGLACTHNRRKYTPEEEETFMEKYDQLPGKTEDPRTHELRKKLVERKKRSTEEEFNMAAEEEEERDNHLDSCPRGSAADDDDAPESHLPMECTDTPSEGPFDAEEKERGSMFMTREMREMMDKRRKEETSRIPVKVNLLKKSTQQQQQQPEGKTRLQKKKGKGRKKK